MRQGPRWLLLAALCAGIAPGLAAQDPVPKGERHPHQLHERLQDRAERHRERAERMAKVRHERVRRLEARMHRLHERHEEAVRQRIERALERSRHRHERSLRDAERHRRLGGVLI